ncbi:MAG TPA: GspE/PulE family protein [Gaiellaceae bacterium]|nr:GspE/PulE family protein [Gaiellaceae bacterium]
MEAAAKHVWPALGTLLVQDGTITAEQLERALSDKRAAPERRLGEILVEHGVVTRAQLARVLAEQHGLEYVDLDPSQIQPDVVSLLPESLARRYDALPVRTLDDGTVLVAVADPTNVLVSDELKIALGVPVRFGVASIDAIEASISRLSDEVSIEVAEREELEGFVDSATVLDLDHETPAVVFVNRSISRALDLGASDVHFTPQLKRLLVRARIDGVVREITSIAVRQAPAVVGRLKVMGELDIAERRTPQDGRVAIKHRDRTMDVRMAVVPTTHGEKVTLRILNQANAPDSLEALGLAGRSYDVLEHSIHQPFGAVVCCGPTGSGKTTTLYACLQELNTPDRVITTIEDPVEYRAPGLDQVEVNPRAGLTFASGLRTILRSDPDVLLVGEMRDEETARIAFRAAMTGHLVLTTLHAQTAAAAVQRLDDMQVDRGVMATTINCIVGQRLARRLCAVCAKPYSPSREEVKDLGYARKPAGLKLKGAVGCPDCGGIGYRGRVGIFEVMPMTDELSMLLGAPTREIEKAAVAQGMLTLRDDAVRLVLEGMTTLEEVHRVAGDALVL